MIADPTEGPRTCSRCVRRYACQTPQACERGEEERTRRASKRDLLVALALLAALVGTLLIFPNWR